MFYNRGKEFYMVSKVVQYLLQIMAAFTLIYLKRVT